MICSEPAGDVEVLLPAWCCGCRACRPAVVWALVAMIGAVSLMGPSDPSVPLNWSGETIRGISWIYTVLLSVGPLLVGGPRDIPVRSVCTPPRLDVATPSPLPPALPTLGSGLRTESLWGADRTIRSRDGALDVSAENCGMEGGPVFSWGPMELLATVGSGNFDKICRSIVFC